MTKRDSSFADLESPRSLMSFPRRHSAQHGSGAASSSANAISSSSNAMLSWAYDTAPLKEVLNRTDNRSPSIWLYCPSPFSSSTTCQSTRPFIGSISVTIGDVTEPSGAPHSHLQRSHSTSPVRPRQSSDGD